MSDRNDIQFLDMAVELGFLDRDQRGQALSELANFGPGQMIKRLIEKNLVTETQVEQIMGHIRRNAPNEDDIDTMADEPDSGDGKEEEQDPEVLALAAAAAGNDPGEIEMPSQAQKEYELGEVLKVQPPPGFKLLKVLGKGGYGRVYQVEDSHTGRTMALKVLLSENLQKRGIVRRFQRETKITAILEHPNIIPIYETGQLDDGSHYYVMQEIKGGTLKALLFPKDGKGCTLSITERLELFLKICDGLDYAHSMGVVHRDLKSANVAIGNFGEVIVLDWGIARAMDVEEVLMEEGVKGVENLNLDELGTEMETLTIAGSILGTPGYMAPEQLEGKEIDHRSDIFALGVILFEMLTLTSPFPGNTKEKVIATLMKEYPHPAQVDPKSQLPEELSAIIQKCMDRDRDQRYQSVKELKDDINRYMQGYSVSVKTDSYLQQALKWINRNSAWGEVLAGLMIVVLLGVWGYGMYDRSQKRAVVDRYLTQAADILDRDEVVEADAIEKRYYPQGNLTEINPEASPVIARSLKALLKARRILEQSLELALKDKKLRTKLHQRLFEVDREIGLLAMLEKNYLLSEISFERCIEEGNEKEGRKLLDRLQKVKKELEMRQVKTLAKIMEEVEKEVLSPENWREKITEIIRMSGRHISEALVGYLSHDLDPVRIMAVEALGRLGDGNAKVKEKSVVDHLQDRLKKLNPTKKAHQAEIVASIWALGRLRARDTYPLVAKVRKESMNPQLVEKTEIPTKWIAPADKVEPEPANQSWWSKFGR